MEREEIGNKSERGERKKKRREKRLEERGERKE